MSEWPKNVCVHCHESLTPFAYTDGRIDMVGSDLFSQCRGDDGLVIADQTHKPYRAATEAELSEAQGFLRGYLDGMKAAQDWLESLPYTEIDGYPFILRQEALELFTD
jgi:hypothetical protein